MEPKEKKEAKVEKKIATKTMKPGGDKSAVIKAKFKCEKDGKLSLIETTKDVDGGEAIAGSNVAMGKKHFNQLEPKPGDVFECAKLKYREKANHFYASGEITKIEKADEDIPSMHDVLMAAPKPNGFTVKEDTWALLLRNIFRSEHTILVGPTGSGKTELIKHAAKQAGYNCEYFNIGNSGDPRSKLIGNIHLVKDGKDKINVTEFVESRFVNAIQTKTVILLDEINRANPEVNNILLTLLDQQGYLELDEHKDSGIVYKHPECVIIGTANIGDEYVGTSILDRAFKDRVFLIEVDYLTRAEEKALLISRTGIDAADADAIAKFAETCRGMWKKNDLATPVSTRMTLSTASLIKDGFSFAKAIQAAVVPYFEDDGTASSDATKIKQTMQKEG